MAVFKHIFEIWHNGKFCSKNVLVSKNAAFQQNRPFFRFQNTLRRRMLPITVTMDRNKAIPIIEEGNRLLQQRRELYERLQQERRQE